MIKLIQETELKGPLEALPIVESKDHNWFGFFDGFSGYPVIVNMTPMGDLVLNPRAFKDDLISFAGTFLDEVRVKQMKDAISTPVTLGSPAYLDNYILNPLRRVAWTAAFRDALVIVIRPYDGDPDDVGEIDVHECVHAAQNVLELVAETDEIGKLSKEFIAMLAGRYYSIIHSIKQHLRNMMVETITGEKHKGVE